MNTIVKTILTPKSMRTLSTPLMLYYKTFLAATIGSAAADKVIRYSYRFSARMDEGINPPTELEQDLNGFFYPTLGIVRGLLHTGFSPEDAEELMVAMWEFAPAEFKTGKWQRDQLNRDF